MNYGFLKASKKTKIFPKYTLTKQIMTKAQDRKLLKLWSEYVRKRDKHCQWKGCKKKEVLHAHHIIGRRGRSTRYLLQNGVALCPLHHTFGINSAHQSSILLDDWLRQTDIKRYKDLLARSNRVVKNIDPKKVLEHLEGKRNDYI